MLISRQGFILSAVCFHFVGYCFKIKAGRNSTSQNTTYLEIFHPLSISIIKYNWIFSGTDCWITDKRSYDMMFSDNYYTVQFCITETLLYKCLYKSVSHDFETFVYPSTKFAVMEIGSKSYC